MDAQYLVQTCWSPLMQPLLLPFSYFWARSVAKYFTSKHATNTDNGFFYKQTIHVIVYFNVVSSFYLYFFFILFLVDFANNLDISVKQSSSTSTWGDIYKVKRTDRMYVMIANDPNIWHLIKNWWKTSH